MTNVTVTPSPKKVLIIEDAEDWRQILADAFANEGFDTFAVGDGGAAMPAFFDYQPDLVLLDLLLPGTHGATVCAQIRDASTVPVIIHSGVADQPGKVEAFRLGADDYVIKGTGLAELTARAHACIRRANNPASSTGAATTNVYRDDSLSIDFDAREVIVRGSAANLTPIEFHLLSALVAQPGHTMRAVELLNEVWGPGYSTPQLVKWHIGRLRKKIEIDPEDPSLVITRWGFGYTYRPHNRMLPGGNNLPVGQQTGDRR